MKLFNNLVTSVGRAVRKVATVGVFGLLFAGGALSAAADSPQFNNLPNDYPTLQVAKAGASEWGSSTNAAVGDTISLMVWDHNTVVNTTARNVTVKVALPAAVSGTHTATATVSADNTTSVARGSAVVNVGAESKLTYIPGSARFLRNVGGQMQYVNFPSSVSNPDAVVTTGINLGDQPGCWQYAQAVLIQVRVEGVTPNLITNKRVELDNGAEPFGLTANARPSDTVNFRVYLENNGNGTARQPKITDTLEDRFSYIPGSSFMVIKENNQDVKVPIAESAIAKSGQTLTWSFADMAPRPSAALYLYFQVKVADATSFPIGTTTLKNKVVATAVGLTTESNYVDVIVKRDAEPVLSFTLRKEVTNRTLGDSLWYDQRLAGARPGDTISYRLTVVNTGNTAASNVTLKDILPAGVSFVGNIKLYNAANPNGVSISGDALVKAGHVFSSIGNGTANSQTIIFDAKITGTCASDTLVNKAQVILGGQVKAQDDATVVIACQNLIIRKEIKDPRDGQYKDDIGYVTEGQVLTYRITVLNNGNTTTRNTIVRDVLPAQTSYVSNSFAIDGEFQSAAGQQAFFSQGVLITDLIPGMGKTITFQVKVEDCPPLGDIPLINTAYVKADGIAEISDTAKATVRVTKPIL